MVVKWTFLGLRHYYWNYYCSGGNIDDNALLRMVTKL